MSSTFFTSSDSARGYKPLHHARHWEMAEPLTLEAGGSLSGVGVTYETYGTLNAARANAILICHALTGDSHVAAHDGDDDPGWWDVVVGAGKVIDTDRYFVICPNILGGCRGTTGPINLNPRTNRPYGADFPFITVGDIVELQRRLLDHLGVARLHAVVGGSLGGQMVLTWAARHPGRVRNAIALATSPRLTSQALAFDVVGRNAILRDPHFHGGQYYDAEQKPAVGLAIARMLGHITYLSRESMIRKFDNDRLAVRPNSTEFESRFAVGSYLAYQGHHFVERFDPSSYVTITLAMDHFDIGDTTAAIATSLKDATCRWLVISFSTDWLFPSVQSRQLVDALISLGRGVSYCEIKSDCGHDAFLLPNDLAQYGEMMRAFLGSDGGEAMRRRGKEGRREGGEERAREGHCAGKQEGQSPGLSTSGGAAAAPLSPSPGTPGEGWGEGWRDHHVDELGAVIAPNPHPRPLPEYRARENAIGSPAPGLATNGAAEARFPPSTSAPGAGRDPTSIFNVRRIDLDFVAELIPAGASVLDLGCGKGELLELLRQRDEGRVMGIERDENAILECLRRGIDVIHADIDGGLTPFADEQFDLVILSQTLQSVTAVDRLLSEMLRVGRRCIVSFPNLAHRKLREQLYHEGRAPRGGKLLGYAWHDSPNRRFLSLLDFQEYCRDRRIAIHRCIALDTETGRQVSDNANLEADVAVFVISRESARAMG